ncbi:MAG: amidohydrolase, partial [Actinomycetota bacterium]|nr:amidohydrolase [Actinomycetota bacterium]
AVEEFVDVDLIVARQEEAGLEHTVLSPWVPLLFYDVEPAEGLRRCRIQNEALATLARGRPDRLSALGAVPLQEPQIAAGELRELMAGGGLCGVELAASVRGVYLGDDRFEVFWAAAEETGALVFVHPTTRGFDAPVLSEYYLWNAVGNPFETTLTAAHMTLAGTMERHPGLRVLLAHGGGALPALRGRLAHAHSFQPQARSRLGESPEDSIRRFFFDSVTHDAQLLRELVAFAGAGQVVLGSDYPFDMADSHPLETLRSAGLEPQAEAAIAAGNAAHLLSSERAPREEKVT